MKYLYAFSSFSLAVLTVLNYTRLNNANDKIEEFNEVCRNLELNSNNYLSSLTDNLNDKYRSKVLLMTGDTITLIDVKSPCLFYFFSPSDCMSCVEENIFTLIEMAKSGKLSGIFIITTKEKFNFLKLMSRVNKANSLYFGCLLVLL